MLNICIVEDDPDNIELLSGYIKKFCAENRVEYRVESFTDGLAFLDAYRPVYDLVFMDIQLPNIDGMEAARRLRENDRHVGIIFVTNLLKYAIHGYEVQAFDYIVKPVNYYDFNVRMKKFLEQAYRKNEPAVLLSFGGKLQRVPVRDIVYVEVTGHNIRYHVIGGDILVHGSLASAEQILPAERFARCNSGFLVNLDYVQALDKDVVQVAGEWLPVSRPKKKEFAEAVTKYIARR